MTFTATPQPANVPPRVRLDIDSDDAGASFTALSVTRDGALIREQPFVGGPEALTFDYEAPFGVPVTYDVTGTYLPTQTPDWTESWASLAAWTGDTADFSVSGGKARSGIANADITRSASGTIQRVAVTDPVYVRVQLLDVSDAVVATVTNHVGGTVSVTGTTSTSVAGSGSFVATLADGTITAQATDASWSASRPYTGTPTKVRIVSLGVSYPAGLSFSSANAAGVAVDSSGNIYVADNSNKLIRKYNSAGVAGITFSTTGTPYGVAVDSTGNVYVADFTNSLIRKYNSAGVAGITFSTTGKPYSVAVDSSGNIYVGDGTGSLIRKYNSAGVAGITFSTTGLPSGVAVDTSGNIYVADDTNQRIRKFNSAGVAGITWSIAGFPNGVAVDSTGNVYVADGSYNLIRKYTSAGVAVITFSTTGFPYGIAVDSTGSVYVADGSSNFIRKYVSTTPSVGAIAPTLAGVEQLFNATTTVTLEVDEAWLIHPTQPSLSASIDLGQGNWRDDGINVALGTGPSLARRAVATTHSPVGRRRSVVITHGDRLDGEWTLVLYTPRLQDRNTVAAIITDQTPLLFRAPQGWSWDLPDGWYSIGDVDEQRLVQGLQHPDRNTVLPLTPVDEPIVRQGAVWTWGGVLLTYNTWAELLAANDTWLDVLAGPES